MSQTRIAYMPLATYPEEDADESVVAATRFAAALDCTLHLTTFAISFPHFSSALGNLLLDVPGLVRAAEEKGKAECQRLQGLVQGAADPRLNLRCISREVLFGAAMDEAAAEARCYDLAVRPWSGAAVAAQDMSQAIVFGSGRPTILLPPKAVPASLKHIAIAWDGSRVAARALGDAVPLLVGGGRISVLTVRDEKLLSGLDLADTLASLLEERGFSAKALSFDLGGKTVAEALQDAALSEGAELLAMGGYGHSRMRDFILGGATKGVLAKLRLPVLLSH